MPSKEEYFNPESSAQSNKHWLPWIQRQLILKGILAQCPELPEPYEPIYEKWCAVFEQFKIDQDTILIGHSCGGGFLVRWLSENQVKVGRVILVAPFLDPNHDEVKSDFFLFQIDQNLTSKTKGLTIIVSPQDDQIILDSVNQIKGAVPDVQVISIENKGHFTLSDMGTDQFPELLKVVLS